jgi:AcrR family transcriptional regulator
MDNAKNGSSLVRKSGGRAKSTGVARRRANLQSSPGAEARSQEIVEAAARVFCEKGYMAATTRDIARAVGIDNTTLYYYVRSKEDLLYRLAVATHDATDLRMRVVEASRADPASKLRQLITGHLLGFDEQPHRTHVYYSDWHNLTGAYREDIKERRGRYVAYVTDLIRQGRDEGLFDRRLDPAVTTFGILTLLNSLHLWYRPDGRLSLMEIAETYCTLILEGLTRTP